MRQFGILLALAAILIVLGAALGGALGAAVGTFAPHLYPARVGFALGAGQGAALAAIAAALGLLVVAYRVAPRMAESMGARIARRASVVIAIVAALLLGIAGGGAVAAWMASFLGGREARIEIVEQQVQALERLLAQDLLTGIRADNHKGRLVVHGHISIENEFDRLRAVVARAVGEAALPDVEWDVRLDQPPG
jgi:MFS family permease